MRDLVVVYTAPWCGPCKNLKPVVLSLAAKHPQVEVVFVDVDEHADLCTDLGIEVIPTVQLWRHDNEDPIQDLMPCTAKDLTDLFRVHLTPP